MFIDFLNTSKVYLMFAGDGAPGGGGFTAPGSGPGPAPLEHILRQQLLGARRVLQGRLHL